MNICCILPYSSSTNRNHYEQDILIQSGLYELESSLNKMGFSVLLLDFLSNEQSDPQDLNTILQQFHPDVLCINSFICFEDYLWLYEHLSPNFREIPHIIFGVGALDYERILSENFMVDYVVPAYPEIVLPDLLLRMKKHLSYNKIQGVAYKNGGRIIYEKRIEADTTAFFPITDIEKFISKKDSTVAFYYSSKGCWYGKCKFCTVGAAYQGSLKWIPCDLERVCSDIQTLYNFGVRMISFLDDQFIGPGKNGYNRTLDLVDYLSKFPDLKFTIRTRITTFDNLLLEKMIKAGLSCVFIGIESCNDRFLQLINKGVTYNDIEKQWTYLIQSPIKVIPGMLLAHPLSNLSDIREHLVRLRHLYKDCYEKMDIHMLFHELHLHAGTPIYKETYDEYCGNLPSECTCFYSDFLVSRCIRHFSLMYRVVERNLTDIQTNYNSHYFNFCIYRLKVKLFQWLLEITQLVETNDDMNIENFIETVISKWRYGS